MKRMLLEKHFVVVWMRVLLLRCINNRNYYFSQERQVNEVKTVYFCRLLMISYSIKKRMHRNLAHYYGLLRRFTIRDQIEPSSSEDDFVALTSWAKGKDDSLLGPSNPENKTWARRVSDADEDVDLFWSRCISGCKWSSLIAASYTGTVRSWAVTGNIQERMRGCRKSNLFPKNINSLEWLTQCDFGQQKQTWCGL